MSLNLTQPNHFVDIFGTICALFSSSHPRITKISEYIQMKKGNTHFFFNRRKISGAHCCQKIWWNMSFTYNFFQSESSSFKVAILLFKLCFFHKNLHNVCCLFYCHKFNMNISFGCWYTSLVLQERVIWHTWCLCTFGADSFRLWLNDFVKGIRKRQLLNRVNFTIFQSFFQFDFELKINQSRTSANQFSD